MDVTRKKLREARFFHAQLMERESQIFRPEPEARDFYLSAFLSAARSVGDTVQAEEGDRYRRWFAAREQSLSDEEKNLLKFTNAQRVQAVHVRGPQIQETTVYVPIHQLQRELEARGGNLEIRGGGVPGEPIPVPDVPRGVSSFEGYPNDTVSDLCGRYLQLLDRVIDEYEQSVVQSAA